MNSDLGLATLKSTTGYIGIRAQLRNPINRKLPRIVKQSQVHQKRDLGSLGFTFIFFSFLFFSFLFLIFLYFRRFRADYFLVLFSFVVFSGSGCYR